MFKTKECQQSVSYITMQTYSIIYTTDQTISIYIQITNTHILAKTLGKKHVILQHKYHPDCRNIYQRGIINSFSIFLFYCTLQFYCNCTTPSYLHHDSHGQCMYLKVCYPMWIPQGIPEVNMLHLSPVPPCMS